MAINLNPLSLFSSVPISPKVALPAGVTTIVAAFTGVMQSYWPSVHLPNDTTLLILAGILWAFFGYIAPIGKGLVAVVTKDLTPPAPVVVTPVAASVEPPAPVA
jgi:hypothetical protein